MRDEDGRFSHTLTPSLLFYYLSFLIHPITAKTYTRPYHQRKHFENVRNVFEFIFISFSFSFQIVYKEVSK